MKSGKIFLICFILVILSLLLYLFKSFLLVMAIAALMAVATSNLHAKFLSLTKQRKLLASTLTTSFMILLFFAPFIYTSIELAKALRNFDINLITQTLDYIKHYEFSLPSSFDLNSLYRQALTYASSFTKSGAKFLMDMALICVFYFFANLYGTELVIYLKTIVPINKTELDEILGEVGNVMAVVLYSMIIVAIFQGALFGIIMFFYGYDGLLMGVIFAVSSLIPAVGGALVYVPVSLYTFASGNLSSAIVILIYSFIMISFVADTLIKPLIIKWINEKLVKTPTNINELLIFLAMIAGISSFGFWGIILGPAILTFFISTLRLYNILKDKNLI